MVNRQISSTAVAGSLWLFIIHYSPVPSFSISIREDQAGRKFAFPLPGFDARPAWPRQLQPLADVLESHAIALAFAVILLGRDGIQHFDLDTILHELSGDADGTAAR